MTHEERVKLLSSRLYSTLWDGITWNDVTSGVGAAPTAVKAKIVSSIKEKDNNRLGVILGELVREKLKEKATAIVETDLADGSLDESELDKYLS